ncbi:hypothetical protein CLU79DRAFT_754688 [Phycomyces nitens]|nr:hypothetical protein CLU79DRAFT_754688 [Phycomyces nitens]
MTRNVESVYFILVESSRNNPYGYTNQITSNHAIVTNLDCPLALGVFIIDMFNFH